MRHYSFIWDMTDCELWLLEVVLNSLPPHDTESRYRLTARRLDSRHNSQNQSCLIQMSHVSYDCIMSHMSVMSHMDESCLIWMSHVSYEWVMSHMNESCLMWMSHISREHIMSHTRIGQSCFAARESIRNNFRRKTSEVRLRNDGDATHGLLRCGSSQKVSTLLDWTYKMTIQLTSENFHLQMIRIPYRLRTKAFKMQSWYVYIYMYMYIYVYVCTHNHKCIYTNSCIYVCIYIYTCIHIFTMIYFPYRLRTKAPKTQSRYVYIYMYMYIHVHVCIHNHICIYVYVYVYTCIHIY